MRPDVLIVDDRERLCRSLLTCFAERGVVGEFAVTPRQAMAQILTCDSYRVVILDVVLGDEDGLELMRDILRLKRDIQIIVITGHATVDMAVDALKAGALDFIEKPVPFARLFDVYRRAVSVNHVADSVRQRAGLNGSRAIDRIVTADSRMTRTLMDASRLAGSDLPVLIEGESGTGKELVADLIHGCSPRSDGPLLKVNCASFSENLLDNELFGHEAGAYTGADRRYRGVFERAHGGSLFLDELGDMPLYLQPRVLRAVQNRQIHRLGGTEDIRVDVRFIAATNQHLDEMVECGTFRKDLFYRLNAARIDLPPLRERIGDIPLLAARFLEEAGGDDAFDWELDESAVQVLMDHDWPGNIRELQNAIRYAVAVCPDRRIGPDHLPRYLRPESLPGAGSHAPLEAGERRLIERTLHMVRFNKKRAAEMLKISRVTLYKKIEKYGITADG